MRIGQGEPALLLGAVRPERHIDLIRCDPRIGCERAKSENAPVSASVGGNGGSVEGLAGSSRSSLPAS